MLSLLLLFMGMLSIVSYDDITVVELAEIVVEEEEKEEDTFSTVVVVGFVVVVVDP